MASISENKWLPGRASKAGEGDSEPLHSRRCKESLNVLPRRASDKRFSGSWVAWLEVAPGGWGNWQAWQRPAGIPPRQNLIQGPQMSRGEGPVTLTPHLATGFRSLPGQHSTHVPPVFARKR